MTRRTSSQELEQARTSREVHAALERAPGLIERRTGGRHIVYVGKYGSVPVPNHPGELGLGLRRAIIKMSLAAGLLTVIVLVLLPVFRVA